MNEPQKPQSWWHTLPGVLTAIAAVITAITGLAALLFQSGVLGRKAVPNSAVQPVTEAVKAPDSVNLDTSASPAHQAQAAGKSWSDTLAVVLSRDGATTRLRANSFSNCISVNFEISLESGQSIPFERMSSFEVLRADDHTSPNAKARLKIQLVDGSEVSGTVDAKCDLVGYNDVGRFAIYWDRLQRVQFER
jgi:serine/threonine-protein kinase